MASSPCQTGSQPCLCVEIRLDMITSLQDPTVRPTEVKKNHTCSVSDRSLPSFPQHFPRSASQKGFDGSNSQNDEAREEKHERTSYQFSGSLTPVFIIKATCTSKPVAAMLWQHWYSVPCRGARLSSCQQHQLTPNLPHFKEAEITVSGSKT